MSARVAGVLTAILCGVAVAPAAAQGLADVARKEVERRDQIKARGRVLTNADLPASAVVAPAAPASAAADGTGEPTATTGAGEAGVAAAEGAPKAAPAAATATPTAPKDDEEGWRQRAATVNGELAEARAQVRQLKALADRLGLEMAATDKSIAARAEAERAQVRTQLGQAEEKATAAAAARQALEQEARISGVPPAWIQ
jgi:hypothetical protein